MDSSLPVVRMVAQRGQGDCAIACLAMYLGKSYEDVLAAAVSKSKNTRVHHTGMYIRQIRATAGALGVKVRATKKVDLDSGCGILHFTHRDGAHVVLLKAGLIFDPDGATVWDPDLYILDQEVKEGSLQLIVAVD